MLTPVLAQAWGVDLLAGAVFQMAQPFPPHFFWGIMGVGFTDRRNRVNGSTAACASPFGRPGLDLLTGVLFQMIRPFLSQPFWGGLGAGIADRRIGNVLALIYKLATPGSPFEPFPV